ncbi:myb-like protein AA [Rhodamnia argentea]|uniref:Myb-like protein AA n=1 Tax=Rhodamnia argentea TaxID=178133 RepID=A0ABM3H4S6_9MYRT|nr:myb-like protein AA [Rhodamnia argentea]
MVAEDWQVQRPDHIGVDSTQKDSWSIEEDKILIKAHMQIGNKWAKIAETLPGRTGNAIKNYWNTTKHRQLSQRKVLPHNNSNLLQDYIRSVTVPSLPKRSPLGVCMVRAGPVPPEVPNHAQPPPPAQTPANNYFGFPMGDGNGNLGLYRVKDNRYHQVQRESGGNGSEERFGNGRELNLEMSLEMDGDRHHRHHPHHHNDYQRREIKKLDFLEMMACRSG